MLRDEINLTFKAGDGGRGVVSFGKMEKSGPDGGNGGNGGDLYVVTSSDLTLLSQFHPDEVIEAETGGRGSKEKRSGKRGEDREVKLPVGTLIVEKESGREMELNKVGMRVKLCRGGKGGIGNFELRSSTNTTPKTTIPPTNGETKVVFVSLRFLADFGLIGLPSAGKSSLLNELTNTDVKTAEYHFTTLSPNLGVLPNKKIIADIPGLIEGAHSGRGLGIKFLKHIQKVSILLHCISLDSDDYMRDYKIIREELGKYSEELLEKQEIILLTKSDLVHENVIKEAKQDLATLKRQVLPVSIHDLDAIEKLHQILAR